MSIHRYSPEAVMRYVTQVLVLGYDIPQDHAKITAKVLVEADMKGIQSHGINTLDNIVLRLIKSGVIISDARPEKLKSKYPTIDIIDANACLGHISAMEATDLCIEKARRYGMAEVYVKNANHFGAAGIYSETIAKEGFIAFVTCTGGSLVAPYGGNKKRLGTNPIAWSIPYDKGIVTIDMATTPRAANHIFAAIMRKDTTFPFSVIDRDGKLTLDVGEFSSVEDFMVNGCMTSIGSGDGVGYKGSGLAILIELRTNIAAGSSKRIDILAEGKDRLIRQTFQAQTIDALFSREEALTHISRTIVDIREHGSTGMLLPGEKEQKALQNSKLLGVAYSDDLIERLHSIGRDLSLADLEPV